uniref:Uncharacterized protein n=1 Tax=Zonotrichia albicollis TaxID=44394 RepID=A0A8D2MXA2_ZONAL
MGRRVKGSGYHSRMPEMLKKKWHRAICKDGIPIRPGMWASPAPALALPIQPSHGPGLTDGRWRWAWVTHGDMWSPSYSPVLMTFWMALATCPLSRELRSLTRRMRQVQSMTRDPASSTSPTARSGSGVSVKRCSPAPQHGWTRGWGWPGPAHSLPPQTAPHLDPSATSPSPLQ